MQEKTRHKWASLIELQEASGLSIVDFCDKNQLSPQSFYCRKKDLIQSNINSPFIKVRTTISSSEINHLKFTLVKQVYRYLLMSIRSG